MPETLTILATQYTKYMGETLNGMRGKTPQYWMTYCQIVDIIHLMQRAKNPMIFHYTHVHYYKQYQYFSQLITVIVPDGCHFMN